MVVYKCFECGKEVSANLIDRRIRCPYCGSKVLFKPRNGITSNLKAR